MAAQKGREIQIRADIANDDTFVAVGGLRSKSITFNEETVDTTCSDSTNQERELLESAGVKSTSISGSGVFKDGTAEQQMLTWKLAGTHPELQFFVPDLGTFTGIFAITNLSYNGEYNGEAQYSMSFESAGQITFAAAV